MKTAIVYVSIIIILWGIQLTISGQPAADFTLPDSSCAGAQITIINLTTGGSTFFWNFCSGNTNSDPTGVNIGNPGNLLDVPTYITLVQDGNDCYSFVSCQFAGIIRYYHGTSFSHNPISWTNLGTFGLLSDHIEGIQVKKDNGNWYGFVCNNTTLVRLDFGASLANTPIATDIGPFTGLNMLHGLNVIKEGTTWLAFACCSIGDKFVRFNFGNSLNNIPVLTDFGNFGIMIQPSAICLVQENLLWYGLIMDGTGLVKLTFGSSLLNIATAQNLGNPGGFNSAGGLSILRDCDLTSGYFTNYLDDGQLGKLFFTGGVTGTITGQVLGNIGNLNKPHSFSEIFRQNDTLFSYITNRGSNTLTRLTFPSCTNSSVPSSILFNPPPFSYNQPGTYNVRLLVNEDLPDQVSLCKTIVIEPAVSSSLDTTICYGVNFFAGGAMQSTPGTYADTLQTSAGCDSVKITNLTVKSRIPIDLGGNRSICLGEKITLDATLAGATYTWQDSSTDSIFVVNEPGIYWVQVTYDKCMAGDTVRITECPAELWFPSAFTPNGDGVNDFFRPKGIKIAKFHLMIYSRWGQMLFETDDMERGWDGSAKGILCLADTYTFVATYEGTDNPGKTKKLQGSFILMR